MYVVIQLLVEEREFLIKIAEGTKGSKKGPKIVERKVGVSFPHKLRFRRIMTLEQGVKCLLIKDVPFGRYLGKLFVR